MPRRKRLLITGISGLLGSALGSYWKDRCEVLGLFNTRPIELPGVTTRQADLLSGQGFRRPVEDFRPDIVVHCAALANVDSCEVDKDLARQMNVDMVSCVVEVMAKSPAKPVHISTDAVYDGATGNHSETEGINPANWYGHTKYLGELKALKYPGALIVRTAFFGHKVHGRSFAQEIVHKLSQKQRVNGFTDIFTSIIYTFDLAYLMEKALEKDLKGIYNFGCCSGLCKYDFAVAVARAFGLDPSLIDRAKCDDSGLKARRGKDLSLNVGKLSRDLNEQIISMDESIKHFQKACSV